MHTCLFNKTVLLCCLLGFQQYVTHGQIEGDFAAWQPKIEALVADYQDLDLFSGVVLVTKDGEAGFQQAYGLADREKQIPNSLQTKFILGSMNKSFTAILIGQLLGEGKLSLDDKLVDHLEGFQQEMIEQVRVSHLLEHSSGFGGYHNQEYFELPYEKKSIATVVEVARQLPLFFPPGEEQEYSNTGYVLLGAIIEKVTGKSYAANVRERIVEPLGLTETYVENIRAIPERSIGYMRTLDGMEDNLDWLHEPLPDGGFWATAADVRAFYHHFFHDHELLPVAVREQMPFFRMIAPYYEEAGVGIPMAGGAEGLNTVHIELLKDGYSITVLANMDEPVAEKIGLGILGIMKGREPEPAQLPAVLNVYEAYQAKGIDYVRDNFEGLTLNFHPTDPRDLILNNLGYRLLYRGDVDDAIAILSLNTELFPEVANVWDSLGEACWRKGEEQQALQHYEKALSIDPGLPSALEAVRQLRQ